MTHQLFLAHNPSFLLFSEQLFSDTRLNQVAQVTKSIKNNLIMQNKPNLCGFQAVSGDYEEKQTQTNPIQTQNKPNSSLSATPQSQNKPNSNPIKANYFLTSTTQSLSFSGGGVPSSTLPGPATVSTEPACNFPPARGLYHRTVKLPSVISSSAVPPSGR